MGILKEIIYGIFSYLPIILLWRFVPVDGSGGDIQYVEAFRLFLFVAVAHIVVAMYLFRPFDRIAMANDFWLVICGVLAWGQLWSQLSWFAGHLRGTGIWVIALPLCLFLAVFSKHGVIGAKMGSSSDIRKYSLVLVATMAVVLVWSYFVRTSVVLSVIAPTIALSFLIARMRKSIEVQAVTT